MPKNKIFCFFYKKNSKIASTIILFATDIGMENVLNAK